MTGQELEESLAELERHSRASSPVPSIAPSDISFSVPMPHGGRETVGSRGTPALLPTISRGEKSDKGPAHHATGFMASEPLPDLAVDLGCVGDIPEESEGSHGSSHSFHAAEIEMLSPRAEPQPGKAFEFNVAPLSPDGNQGSTPIAAGMGQAQARDPTSDSGPGLFSEVGGASGSSALAAGAGAGPESSVDPSSSVRGAGPGLSQHGARDGTTRLEEYRPAAGSGLGVVPGSAEESWGGIGAVGGIQPSRSHSGHALAPRPPPSPGQAAASSVPPSPSHFLPSRNFDRLSRLSRISSLGPGFSRNLSRASVAGLSRLSAVGDAFSVLQRPAMYALNTVCYKARARATGPDQGSAERALGRMEGGRHHLVKAGRHAGRSLVHYGMSPGSARDVLWRLQSTLNDPFSTLMELRLGPLLLLFFVTYTMSNFVWSLLWWWLYSAQPHCVNNFHFEDSWYSDFSTYVSAFLMAVETGMTIGYGFRNPNPCWSSAMLVLVQSIGSFLFDAVVLGVMFVKIAQPKYRARTVFLSDTAVIARRSGVLKLMFRLGDSRRRQVLSCAARAYLFTWTDGLTSQEGEAMPYRVEELPLQQELNGTVLLLPTVLEHTIDERSALWGHTASSLEALAGEIICSIECADDIGQPLRVRRSYLPDEIRWGHMFVDIVTRGDAAVPRGEGVGVVGHGTPWTRVDLSRFHETELQPSLKSLDGLPAKALSDYVIRTQDSGQKPWPGGLMPPPFGHENSLVLSEQLAASYDAGAGAWRVSVRAGDSLPRQNIGLYIRMFLVRPVHKARGSSAAPPATAQGSVELALTGPGGRAVDCPGALFLGVPTEISHLVGIDSALYPWVLQRRTATGAQGQGDPLRSSPTGGTSLVPEPGAALVVSVQGTFLPRNETISRTRVYRMPGDLVVGASFSPLGPGGPGRGRTGTLAFDEPPKWPPPAFRDRGLLGKRFPGQRVGFAWPSSAASLPRVDLEDSVGPGHGAGAGLSSFPEAEEPSEKLPQQQRPGLGVSAGQWPGLPLTPKPYAGSNRWPLDGAPGQRDEAPPTEDSDWAPDPFEFHRVSFT